MRSMFSRMLTLTTTLILVSCLLLGLALRIEMLRYLMDRQEATLLSDAASVAELASAYGTAGELEDNWDFRISLSLAADIADVQTLICDETGTVILCSCRDTTCDFIGRTVSERILSAAADEERFFERGTLDGLFDIAELAVCTPIVSQSGVRIGSVIVFSTLEQVDSFLSHTINSFAVMALVILAIAVTASFFAAKKETQPLKELAETAREFGHGNLSARAQLSEDNTEEMNELAAAFNNMATSLENSETKRQEFVANISHELKTPMTTISGFMDGMLDGTIPPEQHRRYMQTLSDEVRRLSRLVRSMLEISRIQDQGIPDSKKQKFDICETIGRVLLTFEQKINSRRLEVEVQLPDNGLRVFAEPDSITQVIYNLIDNAVKFCGEGGSLFLQVESDGSKATVSVANTGPTIPEEELPLVFDRFHKTDKSRSMDRDGAGLGLYIVRTIVVSHGEDISVTSRDGVTRFSFTLPVK